jgi:hypothetical protein
MTDKKSITAIFLTVIFTLFIITGSPAISISSEATSDKEVKEEKEVKPDTEGKQEKNGPEIKSAIKPETKPKFKLGKEVKDQKNPYEKAEITIKTIPSANKTFGYDILLNGKILVRQPSIPGLPGNEGFTTKERAQKVAEFVVKKIRNNEMPPTVTIDDLNKMGVLK